jgi:peptide/nickel transport system substrate-binding protein
LPHFNKPIDSFCLIRAIIAGNLARSAALCRGADRMGQKSAVVGSIVLAAALAVGIFRPAAAADGVVWARYGDIDTLDPQRATSTLSLQVWSLIYDTLLATDADGRPVPNLAQSYDMSPDGLHYTFHLHSGAKCADGSPLDASDVKYTVDRAFDAKNPSVTKASWGPITKAEVVDPLTVRFDLEHPFVALPAFLADSFSSIICKSNAAQPGFGTTAAIGSGPWKFVSWTKGDRIVLERNPSYQNFGKLAENKGPPYMAKLTITVVPEPEARLAALRTGAADVAEPPLEDVDDLQKSKALDIVIAKNTGQNVFFEYAVHKPPFNDERARQAVAYATDPQAAISLIYGNLSEREWCPVSRGVFGNDEAFCEKHGYPYDPAKAKALLAQMGYGPQHPLEVTFIGWTGGERDKLMQVFQSQLADVGIKADIQIMDIGSMNARVRQENESPHTQGSFDMMTWSWFDPDILYALWHSPGAYRGFTSPELDKMLDETRVLTDPKARLAKVHGVFAYLMDHAIHIGLYTPGWEWVFAVRPQVSGFHVAPFVYPIFSDVKVQ